MKTKEKRVEEILSRGIIQNILPSADEFKKRLLSDEPMRFYIGADPTSNSLHLSHAKNFMLLEEFRQLGHKVFVFFGDLTACIGDPSDRNSARARLTREQARKNVEDWVRQISPIINFDDPVNPAEVVLNSTWFDKMSVTELIELLSNSTVQRMLERDMFQKRLSENRPIHLHEFIYPMFQGFDSVALDVDVEICGLDQTFNALTGRTLVRRMKDKEKFVVCVNLMENPVTGELMSKSNGTGVFLNTDAATMFGQIMALPDEMIELILVNNTRVPLEQIKALDIQNHPRDAKLFAASEVVRIFHGEFLANAAKEAFLETFSNHGFPEDAPVVESQSSVQVLSLLRRCKADVSNSELRRLVKQGAVSLNGVKLTDENATLTVEDGAQLKIGKRGFFLIKVKG
ncbi:MAG: tyrosine--tRNA ligase [Alphaproteobacteria bacterium]|nr:tyrosine--tRNA ligase [Alphaproteobacteria bacterium]